MSADWSHAATFYFPSAGSSISWAKSCSLANLTQHSLASFCPELALLLPQHHVLPSHFPLRPILCASGFELTLELREWRKASKLLEAEVQDGLETRRAVGSRSLRLKGGDER